MMNLKYNQRIFILFFFVSIVFVSCTSDRKAKDQTDKVNNENPEIINDIPFTAVLDSVTQKYTLKKSPLIDDFDLDSINVLEAINRKYPENTLVWKTQRNDTAYVSIPDATYLTQQSGTMGAQVFLAESTYSITEIPGINVVNFDFKIGDHATPGFYKREDFNFKMPYN
jgi:hypothetical protein